MPIRTLLLNANFQPRAVISVERAFTLLYEDPQKGHGISRVQMVLSAEDVDAPEIPPHMKVWRSARTVHPVPLIVALTTMRKVLFDMPNVTLGKPTLPNLFKRDRGHCLYCLRTGAELESWNYWTIDHIIPRHRFRHAEDAHTYENTALSCFACNNRKGGRTPEEAGMTLHGTPFEPRKWTMIEPTLLDCQRSFMRSLFHCAA